MSNYTRGRAFEYRCRDFLRGLGYIVVRSPASRNPWDLLAIKLGTLLFVQCKIDSYCPPSEWNELYAIARSVGGQAIIVGRERRKMVWRQVTGSKSRKGRQPWVTREPQGL